MKRLAFIAVILAIGVGGVAILGAQKKTKPAPQPTTRWTLSVEGVDDGGTTPTIWSGFEGDPATYDPALSSDVTFYVYGADRQNAWNRFHFTLTNPDPLVFRDPVTVPEAEHWMTFRNFAMGAKADDYATRGYTANANRLGPIWSEEQSDWEWPFRRGDMDAAPDAEPSYQAEFLNSGSHPRQFYRTASLSVTFQGGFSFLDMAQDSQATIYTNVGVGVLAKSDCSAPQAVGVGLSLGRDIPPPFQATITRNGENQWVIEVDQPIRLIEYGSAPTEVLQGKKLVTVCSSYLAGGWWTTPVKFRFVVTRVTS